MNILQQKYFALLFYIPLIMAENYIHLQDNNKNIKILFFYLFYIDNSRKFCLFFIYFKLIFFGEKPLYKYI